MWWEEYRAEWLGLQARTEQYAPLTEAWADFISFLSEPLRVDKHAAWRHVMGV